MIGFCLWIVGGIVWLVMLIFRGAADLVVFTQLLSSVDSMSRAEWMAIVGAVCERGKVGARRSSACRRRMLLALISHRAALEGGVYLVLTYGAAGVSAAEFSRHKKIFWNWLRRSYPEVCGIWTLESQQRGVPHLNALLGSGGGVMDAVGAACVAKWLAITGDNGSPSGARALYAAKCVPITDIGGVAGYVAKELGKKKQDDFGAAGSFGDWWGRVNRLRLSGFSTLLCLSSWYRCLKLNRSLLMLLILSLLIGSL